MHATTRLVAIIAGALMAIAANAATLAEAPTEAPPPNDITAYLDAARTADAIEDDEARCVAYPDLPGNTWAPGAGKARCALLRKPMLSLDQVAALLQQPDGAAQLDAKYRALMEAHYTDPAQREQIYLSLWVFNDFDKGEPLARQWLAAAPDSPFAKTAMGIVHTRRGWNARGTRYAQETPDEQLQAMHDHFEAAIPHLVAAMKAEPRLLPACEALAGIGRATTIEINHIALNACLKADPASYYVVQELSTAAEPRWGGSLEALRSVDAYAQAHVAKNPMLAVLTYKQAGYEAGLADDDVRTLAIVEPVSLRAPNATHLREVGGAMLRAKDDERAAVWLSQASRFAPENGQGERQLAQALWRVGERDWAVRHARRAVDLAPDNALSNRVLAEQLAVVEGPEAGRPYWRAAMREPDQREATYPAYCRSFMPKAVMETRGVKHEQLRDALACTDEFTREYPANGEGWRLRFQVLARVDDARADAAARAFLEHMDATRWPEHATFAPKLREAMQARSKSPAP